MESITEWLSGAVLRSVPRLDLSPISGKSHGKPKLSPEQLLSVVHGRALALWAFSISLRFTRPRLRRGPGGHPPSYTDCSIVLMAVVQMVRRKSYEQIIDASLLPAWYSKDPDARWQKYAKKAAVFGYKVHTVLCRQADLPIFVLVTPAHVHGSQVGWLAVLLAALRFGFRVLVVYADSAYFDRRMLKVVHDFLHAHSAINYNLRRAGNCKLATLSFLEQWQRLVINPRADIERHFAWMKRYFGLKYFQCFTLLRVTQFVLRTYTATLAVALASERYQRPEFHRSRAYVLASL